MELRQPRRTAARAALRTALLLTGLLAYGFSMALMVRAGLGLNPWDVFHQGLSRHTGWSLGTTTAVVGLVVLLVWVPLRIRPGIGTVANVVVIAIAVDLSLAFLPAPSALPVAAAMLIGGVVLNAIATVFYIGAGLGPGPRDGLMTGLVARTGRSVRGVRTAIELGVFTIGALLGGSVGVGTVLYALGIGPLVQLFLRLTPAALLFDDFGADGVRRARESRNRMTTMVECPKPIPNKPTSPTPTC
ncbi:membrane protein [Mycolicibacterium chitae]|uniref:Integral membrane protein n=1 Tax=Mycolicibacterium chitae TaxID=1792 RepID=A0A3S4TN89_MYCCI|nr:hypothetical protein [Mycolicibacterium chitae]MCV7106344.1 hypothetical protein [Mycolicibacterium chitae]BBZ05207.1 membrane protein [Mycolicibacterium chitae]VEG48826.1 integral membrane protein [Mycolicibacterium chitae]